LAGGLVSACLATPVRPKDAGNWLSGMLLLGSEGASRLDGPLVSGDSGGSA
jgi:hypothetical protein